MNENGHAGRRRVLCDRHQADLLYSLQLLFEDRLGYELYVPVGHDWWDEGYWRFGQVFGDDRLAQQYLNIDAAYQPVRPVDERPLELVTYDRAHPDRPIRAITLDAVRASANTWAFVVATVQENQAGFHRLAGELGARYVVQVGNTRQQVSWELEPLALVTSEVGIPDGARAVRYHQEFDSTTTFRFRHPWWTHDGENLSMEEPLDRQLIGSFMNLLPRIPECWSLLDETYRPLLPDHRFTVHGIDGPDGNLSPTSAIAERMAGCGWGWHDKPTGDGFGHVIHDWAAIGRPLIGRASFYRGQLAEPFWDDLVTCVDLDRRTPEENATLIREISADPDRHAAMCRAIRKRFEELCDWDAEAEQIRELLA